MQIDHARTRRWLPLVVVLAMVTSTAPTPASGSVGIPRFGNAYPAGDNDCGSRRDTPPAIVLRSGTACYGSTYAESWKDRTDARCPYLYDESAVRCSVDEFRVAGTDGDLVVIDFDDHTGDGLECGTYWWSPDGERGYGSGSAPDGWASGSEGRWGFVAKAPLAQEQLRLHVVTPTRNPASDGEPRHGDPDGDCGTGEDYGITVHVAPNDRPEVTGWSAPATAKPGETVELAVTARDLAGGQLTSVGLRPAPASGWRPSSQWAPVDASGTATMQLEVRASVDLELLARDEYTAVSAPVPVRIEVVQDDCGSGTDVTVLAMALGATCAGHLSAETGDDLDVYEVDAPADTTGLAVDLALMHPSLRASVEAVSPSGARHALPSGRGSLPAEPGTWTIEVQRRPGPEFDDDSSGAYELAVVALGTAGPPAIELLDVPDEARAWEPTPITLRATDPSGRPLHYEIDWGDGHSERYPTAGGVPNGEVVTVSHAFEQRQSPALVTVKAVTLDGHEDSVEFSVITSPTIDACSGSVAAESNGAPDPLAIDPSRPQVAAPGGCAGELGFGVHRVNQYLVRRDQQDTYEVVLDGTSDPTRNGQPVHFVFRSHDQLAYDVEVRSLTVSAGRPVWGDVKASRSVAPGGAVAFDWRVAAPNERFVVVLRPSAGSAPGSYSFGVTQRSALDDL